MFEKIKAYFRPTPKSDYWLTLERRRSLNLRERMRMKESMRSPFGKMVSDKWYGVRNILVAGAKFVGIAVLGVGALGAYLLPLGILIALGFWIFG